MPRKARKPRAGKHGRLITTRSHTLQRIGSCVVMVGVPLSIMGVVFTVVAYGNTDEDDRVPGFYIAGPFLITVSSLCFIAGFILFRMTEDNLYWCHTRCPCPSSKSELCVCFLCFFCQLIALHASRGGNSHAQSPLPVDSAPPKSILSTSALPSSRRTTNKPLHNHVRFDGFQDEETMTECDLSASLTSLHRHSRIHPTNSGSDETSTEAQIRQPSDSFPSHTDKM